MNLRESVAQQIDAFVSILPPMKTRKHEEGLQLSPGNLHQGFHVTSEKRVADRPSREKDWIDQLQTALSVGQHISCVDVGAAPQTRVPSGPPSQEIRNALPEGQEVRVARFCEAGGQRWLIVVGTRKAEGVAESLCHTRVCGPKTFHQDGVALPRQAENRSDLRQPSVRRTPYDPVGEQAVGRVKGRQAYAPGVTGVRKRDRRIPAAR